MKQPCACGAFPSLPPKRDLVTVIYPALTERHTRRWCGELDGGTFKGEAS